MNLEICGNSSHLAPWHAKLGFVRQPWIATLDTLTADGGLVTLVDVVVEKASTTLPHLHEFLDANAQSHCRYILWHTPSIRRPATERGHFSVGSARRRSWRHRTNGG